MRVETKVKVDGGHEVGNSSDIRYTYIYYIQIYYIYMYDFVCVCVENRAKI